jgi:hypothetical protein
VPTFSPPSKRWRDVTLVREPAEIPPRQQQSPLSSGGIRARGARLREPVSARRANNRYGGHRAALRLTHL